MKKTLLAIGLASALLLSGCQTAVETTTTEAMTKEEMTSSETMTQEETSSDAIMTDESSNSMNDGDTSHDTMINKGEIASDFTLNNLQGDTVTLSELKGQKVYLKFWASWCPTCLNGLAELNELSDGMQDFVVYTIVAPGTSGEKDSEAFKAWFAELGYDNIEVLFDESGQVFKDYQVRAVPTSVYIGTDGVVVAKAPGHFGNDKITMQFNDIK